MTRLCLLIGVSAVAGVVYSKMLLRALRTGSLPWFLRLIYLLPPMPVLLAFRKGGRRWALGWTALVLLYCVLRSSA